MNAQCVICKDTHVFTAGNDEFIASALPCGHVFHTACISKWFDQSGSNNQGTCPHCRCVTNKKKTIRLFFDLVPIENYQDDPTVIKANNDILRKENDDLRDRLSANKQNYDKLSKVNSSLRERVLELEQKLVNEELKNGVLTMTRTKLNKKSKELENALDELASLRQKVSSLRALNTVVNGNLKDDEFRVAMEDLEKKDMCLLLCTYKKDSERLLKKVTVVSSDLSKCQEEVRKVKKQLAEAKDENSVLNRILEVYHKPKVKSSNSAATTPEAASCDASSAALVPGPSSVTPIIVTPSKRSLLPPSVHPYKIPKKSHVSTISQSSILKSQPTKAESLTIPESYDGLGGHSRPDVFPRARNNFKIVSDRRPTATLKPRV